MRLGTVPLLGSHRDLVFMGFNAVLLGWQDLYAISVSNAIPELKTRRRPGTIDQYVAAARIAQQYGLKTYLRINTKSKFPEDHPLLEAHPELFGTAELKESSMESHGRPPVLWGQHRPSITPNAMVGERRATPRPPGP